MPSLLTVVVGCGRAVAALSSASETSSAQSGRLRVRYQYLYDLGSRDNSCEERRCHKRCARLRHGQDAG